MTLEAEYYSFSRRNKQAKGGLRPGAIDAIATNPERSGTRGLRLFTEKFSGREMEAW
jgi:hypothetical protein